MMRGWAAVATSLNVLRLVQPSEIEGLILASGHEGVSCAVHRKGFAMVR